MLQLVSIYNNGSGLRHGACIKQGAPIGSLMITAGVSVDITSSVAVATVLSAEAMSDGSAPTTETSRQTAQIAVDILSVLPPHCE